MSAVTGEPSVPAREPEGEAAAPGRRRRPGVRALVNSLCGLVILLTCAITIKARDAVPVQVRPGQGIDDHLFVRGAGHLVDGRWLGPIDHLTLSKGIGYPAFIAATDRLGMQLKVGEQIVYLLAVATLALTVLLLTRRPVLATGAFVVMAFSPLSFGHPSATMLRESFYASLTLLVLGTTALTVLCAVQRRHPLWTLLAAVATGLSFAAFALTREETLWIWPALLLVVAGLALTGPRAPDRRGAALKGLGLVLALAVAAGVSVAPVRYVEHENQKWYGTALANDTTQGEFARMYTDWSGVLAGPDPERQYVPISRDARTAVYAISPSARSIQEEIDATREHWYRTSCRNVNVCDDFSGGFTLWAIREATIAAGDYTTEVEAQALWGRIADDIEKACRDGALTCDLPSNPLAGVLGDAHFTQVKDSALEGFRYTVFGDDLSRVREGGRPADRYERFFYHRVISDVPLKQTRADNEMAYFLASHRPYDALDDVYGYALPGLLVLGLIGLLSALVVRSRRGFALALVVLSLGGAALSRLVVLAVVDTTAFPASDRYYQASTYALLLAGGTLGTVLLLDAVGRRWQARRADRAPGGGSGRTAVAAGPG